MDATNRRYTPTVAAALSGLALKAVHSAVEKRIIEPPVRTIGHRTPRTFSAADVLRLKLWHNVGAILSQERRQRLFDEIERRPAARLVKADALVIVDVGEARKQIAGRARTLDAAEAIISRNAAVMSGEPVFKGTRIPVRMIASMLDDGVEAKEILDGYPKLRAEQLDLARLWTLAHPRRGRPKSLADHGLKAVSRLRTPITADTGHEETNGITPHS